jgi:hypothetical protein
MMMGLLQTHFQGLTDPAQPQGFQLLFQLMVQVHLLTSWLSA